MEIIKQTQINKIQNETLHMKRAKEPRLIINDPWRNLINSIFLLFSFPFFFFFFFHLMQRLEQTSYQKTTFTQFISPTLIKFKLGD